MQLDVSIVSPKKVIFDGKSASVLVPGEQGVFEVLVFHKRIISRLLEGVIAIENKEILIKRGIIRVNKNKVVIIVEEK